MFEHGWQAPRCSPSVRHAGASVALAIFALVSGWALWGEGTEHVNVPDGFLWWAAAAAAGVLVARRLAGLGREMLAEAPRWIRTWFGSGSGALVRIVLLVPGGAWWFACCVLVAARGRRSAARHLSAALWLMWALAGTAGQITMMWMMIRDTSAVDLAPDTVLAAVSILNALPMPALIRRERRAVA